MAGKTRRIELCHYEVVDIQSPFILDKGLYIQQNSGHLGHEGPLPSRTLGGGIRFLNKGPDANLWLVRETDRTVRRLATRAHGLVGMVPDEVSFYPGIGVHIRPSDNFLQAGDGFVILPLGAKCEAGPADLADGRRRPTYYVEMT